MKNYIFQQHETHFSTYGKKNKKVGYMSLLGVETPLATA